MGRSIIDQRVANAAVRPRHDQTSGWRRRPAMQTPEDF
jgi:hypothetical protein